LSWYSHSKYCDEAVGGGGGGMRVELSFDIPRNRSQLPVLKQALASPLWSTQLFRERTRH
jgi:hypothetical protein